MRRQEIKASYLFKYCCTKYRKSAKRELSKFGVFKNLLNIKVMYVSVRFNSFNSGIALSNVCFSSYEDPKT